MASVFKRKLDRNKKGTKWIVRFFDHEKGVWRSRTGYADKDTSLALAQRLERESGLRREGIKNSVHERSIVPIEQPLSEFLRAGRLRGNDGDYIYQLEQRIRRIIEATGVQRLLDFDPGDVEKVLLQLTSQRGFQGEKKLVSGMTRNEYATSIKGFTSWAFKRRYIDHDPLAALTKADLKKIESEHPRRALTAEEFGALLDATLKRPEIELLTIRTGPQKGKIGAKVRTKVLERARRQGQDRWMAYLVAVWTGLRRGELTQLDWADVHLDAVVPHIALRAKTTKSKRPDIIPLHGQLVDAFIEHRNCHGQPSGRVLAEVPSIRVLQRDLAFAGIEYGNKEIGFADLHAQRKTLNLLLAAQGVSGRTRQAQLRHTDPRLTENTYFDASVFLLPQSQEIGKVPHIPVSAATVSAPSGH